MVVDYIIDVLSYDVMSLFDGFPGRREGNCLLFDCNPRPLQSPPLNTAAGAQELCCVPKEHKLANKSSKQCLDNSEKISSKCTRKGPKSTTATCKKTKDPSKLCSSKSSKKCSKKLSKKISTVSQGCAGMRRGLWSRINFKFNEFFSGKKPTKSSRKCSKKSEKTPPRQRASSKQICRSSELFKKKLKSTCSISKYASRNSSVLSKRSSKSSCPTSRDSSASSCSSTVSSQSCASSSCLSSFSFKDSSSSCNSETLKNCEIFAQVLCESLTEKHTPKLKRKTHYVLCKEESQLIEARACALYAACQERRGCKKYPAFASLKHWQKLAYYWAAISHEPLCTKPFDNFVRSLALRQGKNLKQAQSKNFQNYASELWNFMTQKDKLNFVIEALMAVISEGKVDLFNDDEVDEVWAQLKRDQPM